MIGAANRDEAIFPQGDEFDPRRPRCPHLAFGYGPHFCIGSKLGRLVTSIAVRRLYERYPSLSLAEEAPPWRESLTYRALPRLRVSL
jgi:cytochrome P450